MLVADLQLKLPQHAVTQQYALAYAYRMINTRQVDEYVEKATITVSLSPTQDAGFRWTVQYVPEAIDYVGSPEAVQFFQWQQQQCQQRPQLVALTNEQGVQLPRQNSVAQPSTILAGHLAFITAGIWGTYPTNERVREQVLPQHFGAIDLPLLEILQPVPTASGYEVLINGQVDKDRFEQARFSRFVKDMTDIYDMSTRVDLTHEVHYWLSNNGLIDRAEAYTETEVANAYNINYARTLTRL